MTATTTTIQNTPTTDTILFSRNLVLETYTHLEFQVRQSDPLHPIINGWSYGEQSEGHRVYLAEFKQAATLTTLKQVWREYREWLNAAYPLCCECGEATGNRVTTLNTELCDSCIDWFRFVD